MLIFREALEIFAHRCFAYSPLEKYTFLFYSALPLILHPSGAAGNMKNLSLPQVKNLAGGFGKNGSSLD